MRVINKESDYAITALVSLAKKPGTVASAVELARELRIPGAFLRRILQRLGRKGIINSKKGIGGGFELAMKPDRILVGDVVAALQGQVRLSDCGMRKTICERHNSCTLRGKLKTIEKRLISELMAISIASLVKLPEIAAKPVDKRPLF